jgi:hypothetical protein
MDVADHSGGSITGVVGSNPTQSMEVTLSLFCGCVVLCR